jgi:DNA-binding response OmpR family regulator
MANSKVMIVDDNKKFLEELEDTLTSSGYETIVTADPQAVLPLVSAEKPQVILLDLKMPGKSGFQVAHDLRHVPEIMHIPIIAMTASFNYGYQTLLDMCDIKKCLKKPFTPLEVITEIEAVLV